MAWPLVAGTVIVLARSAFAAVRWLRTRHTPVPPLELVWVVAGLTVAFVVIGGDLVELGENGRFRSMLDPLLFALVAVVVTDGVRWLSRWSRD